MMTTSGRLSRTARAHTNKAAEVAATNTHWRVVNAGRARNVELTEGISKSMSAYPHQRHRRRKDPRSQSLETRDAPNALPGIP